LDGDGALDALLWEGRQRRWRIHAQPRRPRGLLVAIQNGQGGVTRIHYASSRQRSVVTPAPMPAHVWVVERVEAAPGFGALVVQTRYRYAHPQWLPDADGRHGFRGFASVRAESPGGAVTERTYDHGLFYKGLATEVVTRVRDGAGNLAVHSIVASQWERGELFRGVPTHHVRATRTWTCSASQPSYEQCRAHGALRREATEAHAH